ncbi:hypothetical protein ACPMJQ_34655 [Streptomyces pseudogriseolus]|uniref:hypothetical protein n=1 Tax=Streptomyces pseudogriseolus TaxID=36817 RepID=UPI003FA1F095
MKTYLQHALELVIDGVLTQLPAQLITAAVAAAAATWMRARQSRARAVGASTDPGADASPQLTQADASERSSLYANDDSASSLGKR